MRRETAYLSRLTRGLGICAALLAAAGSQAAGGRDLLKGSDKASPEWRFELEAEARSMAFSRGRLFRVTKGGKTSYLLGTLHTPDPRLADLRPQAREALASARLLALELPEMDRLNEADIRAIRDALLAPEDRRAYSLLSLDDYILLLETFGKCTTLGFRIGQLKPFAIALMADNQNCGPKQSAPVPSMEQALAGLAKDRGVPIVGLESLVEQIDVADGLPKEIDRELLKGILRQAPYSADIEETEIQLYLHGDTGLLVAWMKCKEPIPGLSGAQLPARIFERLITLRNHRLAGRAAPLLEKGDAFVAIGAAHLPGAEGVAQLLENRGFKLEALE